MSHDPPTERALEFHVAEDDAGARLDRFLAAKLDQFSRAHLRRIIDAGGVTVDGENRKPSFSLPADARVCIEPIDPPREIPEPENIPLDVLFEDDAMAVVNKPAGMVVHAAGGTSRGTLAAALSYRFNTLSTAGGAIRPGIVHRLDRDTTGVIIVAKSDASHANLSAQFKARTVEKEYMAIVVGAPDRDRDRIEKPIGVHPTQRQKMAIRAGHPTSRDAETFYEVVERFDGFAVIRAIPKTGRTHQIRVHLASIGFPVLCDRLYGGRRVITRQEIIAHRRQKPPSGPSESQDALPLLDRQALHARRLAIDHPTSGERLEFESPPPYDMTRTLAAIRELRGKKSGERGA